MPALLACFLIGLFMNNREPQFVDRVLGLCEKVDTRVRVFDGVQNIIFNACGAKFIAVYKFVDDTNKKAYVQHSRAIDTNNASKIGVIRQRESLVWKYGIPASKHLISYRERMSVKFFLVLTDRGASSDPKIFSDGGGEYRPSRRMPDIYQRAIYGNGDASARTDLQWRFDSCIDGCYPWSLSGLHRCQLAFHSFGLDFEGGDCVVCFGQCPQGIFMLLKGGTTGFGDNRLGIFVRNDNSRDSGTGREERKKASQGQNDNSVIFALCSIILMGITLLAIGVYRVYKSIWANIAAVGIGCTVTVVGGAFLAVILLLNGG